MAYGIARYAQTNPNLPQSPSDGVWADCLAYELQDEGNGYFQTQHFYDVASLPGLPNSGTPGLGGLTQSFVQAGTFDHVLSATVAGTAQAFTQIYTRPLGPIASGGTGRIWFEASLAVSDVTTAKGIFVGVANTQGLVPTTTAINGGIVAAASATRASNSLGAQAATSCFGFWLHGDLPANFDAVYLNQGTAVAPNVSTTIPSYGNSKGTLNTVLLNVLTANANNPDPGNPFYTPPTPPGLLVVTGTTGQTGINTGSAGFVKLGVNFDTYTARWFVNGYQVAKYVVDSTWDQTSDYGGIVSMTTATTAAPVLDIDFFRTAAKIN
jgi:hypothetical protein